MILLESIRQTSHKMVDLELLYKTCFLSFLIPFNLPPQFILIKEGISYIFSHRLMNLLSIHKILMVKIFLEFKLFAQELPHRFEFLPLVWNCNCFLRISSSHQSLFCSNKLLSFQLRFIWISLLSTGLQHFLQSSLN